MPTRLRPAGSIPSLLIASRYREPVMMPALAVVIKAIAAAMPSAIWPFRPMKESAPSAIGVKLPESFSGARTPIVTLTINM